MVDLDHGVIVSYITMVEVDLGVIIYVYSYIVSYITMGSTMVIQLTI
jgi:hypothetical protein